MAETQPTPRRRFQFRPRVLVIPLAFGIAAEVCFFVWPAIREQHSREVEYI